MLFFNTDNNKVDESTSKFILEQEKLKTDITKQIGKIVVDICGSIYIIGNTSLYIFLLIKFMLFLTNITLSTNEHLFLIMCSCLVGIILYLIGGNIMFPRYILEHKFFLLLVSFIVIMCISIGIASTFVAPDILQVLKNN